MSRENSQSTRPKIKYQPLKAKGPKVRWGYFPDPHDPGRWLPDKVMLDALFDISWPVLHGVTTYRDAAKWLQRELSLETMSLSPIQNAVKRLEIEREKIRLASSFSTFSFNIPTTDGEEGRRKYIPAAERREGTSKKAKAGTRRDRG